MLRTVLYLFSNLSWKRVYIKVVQWGVQEGLCDNVGIRSKTKKSWKYQVRSVSIQHRSQSIYLSKTGTKNHILGTLADH